MVLLVQDMAFPNGLAFSPDFSKLYISNSERKNPIIKVYDVTEKGGLVNGKVFFNASYLFTDDSFGAPDGLKVDIQGNLFASGPGIHPFQIFNTR